ncbi:hypothetical protein C3737_19225 [Aeromonas jandaei]|nr:hypothetical protein C3737_19225 [Aeromonas jandaei]
MFRRRADIDVLFPKQTATSGWKPKKNYELDYINIPIKYIRALVYILVAIAVVLDMYFAFEIYFEYSGWLGCEGVTNESFFGGGSHIQVC